MNLILAMLMWFWPIYPGTGPHAKAHFDVRAVAQGEIVGVASGHTKVRRDTSGTIAVSKERVR